MISDLTPCCARTGTISGRRQWSATSLLLEEDSDAIHVATEHRDGAVFAAVLPTRPTRPPTTWEFGELAADTNEPVIWVD